MPANAVSAPPRSRSLAAAGLALLLLLGLFYVYGAASDLAATAGGKLPADHRGTFTSLTGAAFAHAKASVPGIANYITVLEHGYALHELTFGLLFIVLIAIPFRRRQRWAWWAAWLAMIANLGYTLTFGAHDHAILTRSLIADIALPVLLLAHIPAFFTRQQKLQPSRPSAPAGSGWPGS